MKSTKELLQSLSQAALQTQTEMLEVRPKKGKLYIGIPKEISFQENRVALVPDAVALLVNNGHRVIVESNAGQMANFQDIDYNDAGATITDSPQEVYKADIILKIAPPSPQEITLMQQRQTLISALQECLKENKSNTNLGYFPSYEFVTEELNDWSFFRTDKMHPTPETIEKVFEKFRSVYCN
mgnify:CR=1 FL=1